MTNPHNVSLNQMLCNLWCGCTMDLCIHSTKMLFITCAVATTIKIFFHDYDLGTFLIMYLFKFYLFAY